MKDGSLLTSAGRFTEATIYCVAPPPNQSPAPPDNVKLLASWQSGLETPSGLRQWKLRLQLMSPEMPLTVRSYTPAIPYAVWKNQGTDSRKLTKLTHDKRR